MSGNRQPCCVYATGAAITARLKHIPATYPFRRRKGIGWHAFAARRHCLMTYVINQNPSSAIPQAPAPVIRVSGIATSVQSPQCDDSAMRFSGEKITVSDFIERIYPASTKQPEPGQQQQRHHGHAKQIARKGVGPDPFVDFRIPAPLSMRHHLDIGSLDDGFVFEDVFLQ